MGSMLKKVKNIPEMKKGDIWGFVKGFSGHTNIDNTETISTFLVVDKINSVYELQPLDGNTGGTIGYTTKDFVAAYYAGLLVKKA